MHYQNFAVTDDSVIFYFGRAELLPSYAGETSVTVPRSALPPLSALRGHRGRTTRFLARGRPGSATGRGTRMPNWPST